MLCYDLIDNKKNEYIVLLHAYGGNSRCFKKQLKSLSKFFNILLIDMHGHGKSSNIHLNITGENALKSVTRDINETILSLGIEKAHFMGLSLGTIVANVYAIYYPKTVLSILNVGAVIKFKSVIRYLLKTLYKIRKIIPHSIVYPLAGIIIMPQKSHKISRKLFVRESKKMNKSDFYNWAKVLIDFQEIYSFENTNDINTIYISGEDDYFFIKEVKDYCIKQNINFYQIENSGHICNIDNCNDFNILIEKIYYDLLENIDIA